MVLTLYKMDVSPPARAVMMVIETLNIPDVNYVDVNLLNGDHLKDEYIQMNPQHTVPTIKEDDFVIWDSHAINCYLVSKYAKDDALYPKDLKKRAIIDQKLHFDSGILFPALRGTAEPVIFWGEKAFKPESLEKIKKAYELINKLLTGTWLAGDSVTLADICCVTTVNTLNVLLPIDENEYPNLWAWLQRCSELECYKKCNAPGIEMCHDILKSKLG